MENTAVEWPDLEFVRDDGARDPERIHEASSWDCIVFVLEDDDTADKGEG